MAFIKKHLMILVFALVCLGSLGMGGWVLFGVDAGITEQMQSIQHLMRDVRTQGSGAANLDTIEARKKSSEARIAQLSESLATALGVQKNNAFEKGPRKLLVPDVLPEPKGEADKFDFKTAYKRAFGQVMERLHGGDKARLADITEARAFIEARNNTVAPDVEDPWRPKSSEQTEASDNPDTQDQTLRKFLSEYPQARAAEVVARQRRMYVDRGAIRPHFLLRSDDPPPAVYIWQAQMSLWIQQDIVEALGRVNDERADQLEAEDRWVAHMPVKRLKQLSIQGWLGKGGGSNATGTQFAESFTGLKNDKSRFIVPIKIDLYVEETALAKVLESLCGIGFYTPIQVDYQAVRPDPLQEEYIYGEAPMLHVIIDLEGYYFRKVYEDWIPKRLKKILERPGAKEGREGRG